MCGVKGKIEEYFNQFNISSWIVDLMTRHSIKMFRKKKSTSHICRDPCLFPFLFFSVWPAVRLENRKPIEFIYLLKVQYSSCIIEPLNKYQIPTSISCHCVKESTRRNAFKQAPNRNPNQIHIETNKKILWDTYVHSDDCFRLNNHFNVTIRMFSDDVCFLNSSHFFLFHYTFIPTYLFFFSEYRCALWHFIFSMTQRLNVFQRNMEI